MEKRFIFLFALCFITVNGYVPCKYRHDVSGPFDIGFPNSPIIEVITILCSNVSSDFSLNFHHYRNIGPEDKVTLEVVNSTVSTLPSNSSLSRFSIVTSLILSNLGIEELSPGAFYGLSNLRGLNVESNKITRIRNGVFDNLKSLRILDLSKNLIENIENDSFSTCTSLTSLILNDNKLKVFQTDLTKGLNLDVLEVSDNPLEEFQELGSNHVGTIVAQNTLLKSLNINLTRIEIYNFRANGSQLEKIDFSQIPRLTIFYVSFNKINLVENWENMSGYAFDFSYNQITEAKIGEQVEVLRLSHNAIRKLRPLCAQDTKLGVLDLSFNEITKIGATVMPFFTKLHTLYLQNNKLSILSENTFGITPALRYLDLSNNAIEHLEPYVFNDAKQLTYVNLANNQVKRLYPISLQDLPKDASVYINDNPVNQTDIAEVKKTYTNIKTEKQESYF